MDFEFRSWRSSKTITYTYHDSRVWVLTYLLLSELKLFVVAIFNFLNLVKFWLQLRENYKESKVVRKVLKHHIN